MLTTDFITTRLHQLASERGLNLRYAIESGSRAWGLASTDSDYDVRFIYQHPKEWYLQLGKRKDMVGPLMELDGELDLAGWDLRKVLTHVAGSNAGVLEWLHSPVIYYQDDLFIQSLHNVGKFYFQPKRVTAHYLGIARSARAKGFDPESGDWHLKKFFYYLRPLLAAKYTATVKEAPPVRFTELYDAVGAADMRDTIDEFINYKAQFDESKRVNLGPLLMSYTRSLQQDVEAQLTQLHRREVEPELANNFFREMIGY